MKRFFDILISLIAIILLSPILLIIALIIKFSSHGPIIYWSNRIGQGNQIFKMPKYRTMFLGSPEVASNLLSTPDKYITPFGSFLRKSSFDELPQLWSVFIGDMSLVGPRPALFNQYDLIALRQEYGIHCLKPGITGLAQINGRDELLIQSKVLYDFQYLKDHSFFLDIRILYLTFLRVITIKGVSH